MYGQLFGCALKRGLIPISLILKKLLHQWLKEMRGEHIPETEEYNISSISFKAKRPSSRFLDFMQSNLDGVYRIKGYFWLSTRMDLWAGKCGR